MIVLARLVLYLSSSIPQIFLALSCGAVILMVPEHVKRSPKLLSKVLFKNNTTTVLQVLYAHTHIRMHTHAHTFTHMYVHLHTHTCMHTHTRAHARTYALIVIFSIPDHTPTTLVSTATLHTTISPHRHIAGLWEDAFLA